MLEVKNVTKNYKIRGRTVTALHHLDLTIPKGDFVSIIGPSGSGKSSLLLMLGGMLSPSEGEVYIDNEALYTKTPDERAKVRQQKMGFVFQTFNLIPYLTALQNVQIPLLLSGLPEDRAAELLNRVGLSDRLDHLPRELSIGQQQRVALARTLANDPEIILADEPTGNLDPKMSETTLKFLTELNQEGKTIVLVTHDMNVAKKTKRSLTIADGVLSE